MYKNVLLLLCSFFTCIILGEIFFRIYPSQDVQTNNEYAYREVMGEWKFLTPYHSVATKFAAEIDHHGYYKANDYIIWFNYNQYGSRWITASEQPLQGTRVLLLGDSFTYGSGIRCEETYAYRLQEKMRANGQPMTVFNFGKSGANAKTSLENYNTVKDRADHQIVLYALHLNDLILFDTSYILRNQAFDWPGARSSKFVEFILKRLNSYVGRQIKIKSLTSPDIYQAKYYHKNMAAIVDLKNQVQSAGKVFRVALLPIYIDLKADTFRPVYTTIKQDLQTRDIVVFDLTEGYESYSDESMWIMPVDQHPNEKANAILAEKLAKAFQSLLFSGEGSGVNNSAPIPALH